MIFAFDCKSVTQMYRLFQTPHNEKDRMSVMSEGLEIFVVVSNIDSCITPVRSGRYVCVQLFHCGL